MKPKPHSMVLAAEFREPVSRKPDAEYEALKEAILRDGRVNEPLIVHGGVLIDGYYRYMIARNHPGIQFDTVEKPFRDSYESHLWRNRDLLNKTYLKPLERLYVLGDLYTGLVAMNRRLRKESPSESLGRVCNLLSDDIGVGKRKLLQSPKFKRAVDLISKDAKPGAKQMILTGEAGLGATAVCGYLDMAPTDRLIFLSALGGRKKPEKTVRGNRENLANAVRTAVEGLYDTKKETVYTADDLEEELRCIVRDFVKKADRALTIRKDVLVERGAKKKMTAVLVEAETAVAGMKGRLQ